MISYFGAISYRSPAWWIGILLILLFAFHFPILPSGGMYSSPPPDGGIARFLDLLKHAALPIITLVLVSVGPYIYVGADHDAERRKRRSRQGCPGQGHPERYVRRRHILRTRQAPIVKRASVL